MYEDHEEEGPWPGSTRAYVWGFLLSLLLTLSAYFLVDKEWMTGGKLMGAILGLALIQLTVQLLFFLHMGKERWPYWNWMAFIFMASIVFVLVGGSLWIMFNLTDRVMLPMESM